MDLEQCQRWIKNQARNPKTGRAIKKDGPVFKKLVMACNQLNLWCDEWGKRPHINPKTRMKIKVSGPTYKKLEKECKGGSPPKSPRSPKSPKSPPKRSISSIPPDIKTPSGTPCDKWKFNKNVNPRTGRSIKTGGPVFRALEKECGPKMISEPVMGKSPKSTSISKPTCDLSWFESRLKTGRGINRSLKDINVGNWNVNVCMSGKDTTFLSNLSNPKVIGMGTFGKVYSAKIGKYPVVIKEAFLKYGEKSLVKVGKYPEEYQLMILIRDVLLSKACPNFLYTYDLAICEGCSLKGRTGTCYITFMEQAHGDLALLKDGITRPDEQLSIFYQLLIGLHTLQRRYGFIHHDIKMANIMVQITPELMGDYFQYVVDGKSYYVRNEGYVVYLADFGVSYTTSPLVSLDGFYGSRNAEVVPTSGGYKWKPITTKESGPPFIWADGQKSTINKFVKYYKTTPTRPVNLTDMERFPPFEFFGDVQDIVKVMIGGKASTQPNFHRYFPIMHKTLKSMLKKHALYPSDKFVKPPIENSVHYVLANKMLAKIYDLEGSGDPTNIIDTFYVS